MLLTEIKVGGIYKTTRPVQLRSPEEVVEFTFLIKVLGKIYAKGLVEFSFLNDNTVAYLEPSQIDPV